MIPLLITRLSFVLAIENISVIKGLKDLGQLKNMLQRVKKKKKKKYGDSF